MAPKSYSLVTLWFVVAGTIVLWDSTYALMRPRSLAGGDLRWMWKFYDIYEKIDKVYDPALFSAGDGFLPSIAVLNITEVLLSFLYIYGVYVASWDVAPLIGFTSATITLSKTALYCLQEYFCGLCTVGHNDSNDIFTYWLGPNILWAGACFLITLKLGSDIASSLKKTKGKTE
ncbi:hypothetical protein BDQ12DRAFT_688007 [Crucibulum laeve]|uniref:Emopamil-binding protein n=1 Tax=Crucibulum laeve TaxID=68775 RepID=A0A5C3LRZ4_9AGAR|nr:hypothetical protein BDQ12DRAFT_688007 [Crucibulum laeve]